MQQNNSPKAFSVGSGGVVRKRLVKLSSGSVVLNTATASNEPIGVALSTEAQYGSVSVALLNAVGTVEIEAGNVVANGATVYAGANGKVVGAGDVTGNARIIGTALEAASGDGAIIEILPSCFCETTALTTTTTTTTTS